MFDNLSDKLDKAFHILKGHGKITDVNVADTLKEVRRALLDADVNFKILRSPMDSSFSMDKARIHCQTRDGGPRHLYRKRFARKRSFIFSRAIRQFGTVVLQLCPVYWRSSCQNRMHPQTGQR